MTRKKSDKKNKKLRWRKEKRYQERIGEQNEKVNIKKERWLRNDERKWWLKRQWINEDKERN